MKWCTRAIPGTKTTLNGASQDSVNTLAPPLISSTDLWWRLAYLFRIILVALGCGMLSGCSSINYYAQAVHGQFEILAKRKSVSSLLRSKDLDPRLRRQLLLSEELLLFAQKQLLLPAGGNYTTYADLKRPYVVWNLFAAPEFSITPKYWCYPFIGCAGYRGFFDKEQALTLERQLNKEGYDVYMGGVKAYSTLGWFNDPLLNTFIYYDDIDLARLIFHELAHKKLYVPGDTDFNESFATIVELEGTRQWLLSQGRAGELIESPVAEKTITLIINTRSKLKALYSQSISDERKRVQKQALIDALREDYKRLTQDLEKPQPFDYWMKSPINNAKLGSVSSYRRWVPHFKKLFNLSADWKVFFNNVSKLAKMKPAQREQQLERILNSTTSDNPVTTNSG
ncbi:aminopeptidase [Candidatus Sororendozoicomonas aggregata]|uniref:aminopeptidase n=1 Tax=Candidatus Sororendozoicomonas aggregata TaxID=3073239 RepID=UPI002ED48EA7